MAVAILDMFSLCHVIHAAGWASASLVAAAAVAVHWTDVCGGVLLAGTVCFCFAGSGVAVFLLVVGAAGCEAKGKDGQDGKQVFFHVAIFFDDG